MDTLEGRIASLERENRRWRRGAVLVLAMVGGLVVMGGSPPSRVSDEIRTRRMTIVDQAGAVRVELAAKPDGASGLVVYDQRGIPRATLVVRTAEDIISPPGATLELHSQEGSGGALLATTPDGRSALNLFDRAGESRAFLTVLPDSSSRLELSDQKGHKRVLTAFP